MNDGGLPLIGYDADQNASLSLKTSVIDGMRLYEL